MTPTLDALLAAQRRRHRGTWRRAGACAALGALAAVALLGVSGWFLAAAAGAGAAGVAAAAAFNYLLSSACIRLLAIVRTVARYGERLLGHGPALRTMAHLRPRLFRALCAMPGRRVSATTTGDATASLMQDMHAIEDRLVRGPAARGAAAAIACGLGLAALGGWAAAAALAGAAAANLQVARRLSRDMHPMERALREALGDLKDEFGRLAACDAELRCYGLEDWARARVAKLSDAVARLQDRQARVLGGIEAIQTAVAGLAVAAVIALSREAGAPLAALSGLSAALALEGLGAWTRGFARQAAARVAGERLDRLLAQAPPEHAGAGNGGVALALAECAGAAGADDAGSPCIDLLLPVRAHLRGGMRVALVGASGCGKTTLVEQLVGLRPVGSGRAFIDGLDVANLPVGDLRRCFAWSPQDATLLGGTVRENLALAGEGIGEAGMWEALRDAVLDERVRALPSGLDTWLGEDGALLSGGERRRLSLARASLSRAPWLLLDEPTEGLDPAIEARLLERLDARLDRTRQGLIVVSHRPAPVALCDRVIRLDGHPADPADPAETAEASDAAAAAGGAARRG